MAPVMTTRMRSESGQSTIWRWAGLDSVDAYFGIGNSQSAMIGQSTKAATDSGKLIINTPDDSTPVIELKNNGSLVANIQTTANSLLVGTMTANSKLSSNTVAIGRNLALEPTSSTSNINNSVVIGEGAKTTRNNAIAIGSGASVGAVNDTGTPVGYGEYSVAIGTGAKSGSYRGISIGYQAGSQKQASENIAIGSYALKSAKSSMNIAIGYNALSEMDVNYVSEWSSNSSYNSVIGYSAMASAKKAYGNIALGGDALRYSVNGGVRNIAIGIQAMSHSEGVMDSIAIGTGALAKTQYANIAIGRNAMMENTTGYENVAVGLSMPQNTTGSDNTAVGHGSLFQNTTGKGNTSIGAYSLWNHDSMPKFTTGDYNTALGFYACDHVQGSSNTCIGSRTLGGEEYDNYAMKDYNTAIGHNACIYTTGSYNTCIGADSGPLKDQGNVDHTIFLGSSNETVYIQGNLRVDGDVELATSTGNIRLRTHHMETGALMTEMYPLYDNDGYYKRHGSKAGGPYLTSDRRLKYVGKENTDGLSKLRQLKIFNYTFKKDDKKVPHVGVIAQDLQKVFPNAVKKGPDGFLVIRQEDMFYALINAVKELDAKISVLIENQKQILKELNVLRKENQELRKRLDKLERR